MVTKGGIDIDQMTFADFDALSERIEFYGFDSTNQRSVEEFLKRGKPMTIGKRRLAKVIVLRKYVVAEQKRVARLMSWYRMAVKKIFEEKKRHPDMVKDVRRRKKKKQPH